MQNKWDVAAGWANIAGRQLSNVIDQVVVGQYTQAGKTLTGTDIGEASGGIVLTAANTANIFTAAGRTLNKFKRLSGNRFALVGPRMLETIQNYVGGRETVFGESVSDNGKIADRFGFGLILSNNLPYSATMTISVTPTDGDTVTIDGVTFTFKTTLTGTATLGEVFINGSAANANANLAKAINDSGTVDTNYSALSSENRQIIEESGMVAISTSTTVAITAYGDVVVAKSMTSASNVWGSQTQYALMGIEKSIHLVTQVAPNIVFRDAQLRLGKYVHPWTLYGVKTFFRMKNNLVAVQFDASSWV